MTLVNLDEESSDFEREGWERDGRERASRFTEFLRDETGEDLEFFEVLERALAKIGMLFDQWGEEVSETGDQVQGDLAGQLVLVQTKYLFEELVQFQAD